MRRRVRPALVVGLLLAAALTACTDDHDAGASSSATARSARTARGPALDARVEVTRVAGRLPAARRDAVAAEIGRVLEAYVLAAYVEGPDDERTAATRSERRRDAAAGGAFAGFTPDAARQARHDRGMLTSAGFGDAVDVEPLEATAFLSVLAPKGRPLGATARTTLRFAVTGANGRTGRRQVTGRVLLTPQKGRWRIFGYELAGGAVTGPAGGSAR